MAMLWQSPSRRRCSRSPMSSSSGMNDLSSGLATTSHVGMRAGRHLAQEGHALAGVQRLFRPRLAEHGLGQLQGERPFADARRTGKQETAGQPPARNRPAKLLDHVVVSFDAVPRHGEGVRGRDGRKDPGSGTFRTLAR